MSTFNTMTSRYGGPRVRRSQILTAASSSTIYTAGRNKPQLIWANVANTTANPLTVTLSYFQAAIGSNPAIEFDLFYFTMTANAHLSTVDLQGIPMLENDEIRFTPSTVDEVHCTVVIYEPPGGDDG